MRTYRISQKTILAALVASLSAPLAWADDDSVQLPDFSVLGSKEAINSMPGSAAYLDLEDIRRQGYDDIHRLLSTVPGVYVREEDGYGLFPNISLRGADSGRSSKVTLMEDGVLMAPAPYAAPAAYYSPTAGRMSGLEVIKGSSQVRFGPRTTGGVVNYLSTQIPIAHEAYLRTAFGSDNEIRNQLWTSNHASNEAGHFAYLVELYHRQVDGFKDIDGPSSDAGPDAGNSGFRRIEPMVKLAWIPKTQTQQKLELTLGQSETDADETYLGLSTADFKATPFRRYVASQFDNIRTQQKRAILRYSVAATDNFEFSATAYRTDFRRNWDKIRRVNGVALGQALAGSNDGADLATLRGEAAGTWDYRDNNRKYYAQGLDLQSSLRFNTGEIAHTLRTGLRSHEDQVHRFQHDTNYNVDATGQVSSIDLNAPGSQANRIRSAEALSLYVEDAIKIGKLTLTPGIRHEQIDYAENDIKNSRQRAADASYTTGGLGVTYASRPGLNLFGGLYQGFSPPSPGSAVAGDTQEEKSLSLELGLRSRADSGLIQEVVAFTTKFDNLLVPDNAGASGTADETLPVGKVDVYGLEWAVSYDLGAAKGWTYNVPVSLAATYTHARIANDSRASGDAESIFSGGFDDARLPYVPDFQMSLNAGLERGNWSLSSRVLYMDESFATAMNTETEVILGGTAAAPVLVPDARGGKIESHVLVDLTARYALTQNFKVFANVFNLFDREYTASRLPEGPRPGAPRSMLVGFEANIF
ncbi:MAG: TonB-dependent receptor [Oceanococcus sp.]|nr:MAG: TonB-dependent receptor [Oceanococcus sp.]